MVKVPDAWGMKDHLLALPQQCLLAHGKGLGLGLSESYRQVDRVVLAGMGGSAIAGDLLAGLAAEEGLPVYVHRDYGPPPSLDQRTLAIFSSYSGNTEETLTSFLGSVNSPSKKLVVTSGGRLGELARKQGVPLLSIDYKAPPRAAAGYSFMALVGALERLGLLADKSAGVAEMVAVLEKMSLALRPEKKNPALTLARRFSRRLVVIYGSGFLQGVARRWKTQLNENAKCWAFFDALPEAHHNSVVGYGFPAGVKARALVVLLSSPLLSSRHRLRLEITRELLQREGVAYEEAAGTGESVLSQMMSLLYLGDWASYYLAGINAVDPSPVPSIDLLKERLAQHPLEEQ